MLIFSRNYVKRNARVGVRLIFAVHLTFFFKLLDEGGYYLYNTILHYNGFPYPLGGFHCGRISYKHKENGNFLDKMNGVIKVYGKS